MSLWGATVITNLLSAIPVFGQDLVQLINNIINYKIYIIYNLLILFINNNKTNESKIISNLKLPTIGKVSHHALKKGNKEVRLNKEEYISIPYQFIAFLVGLIDGDGYIRINKTTKGYISINLVITLHLNDISTLEYIYSVLKLGRLTKSKDINRPTCQLVINKTDLQEVIFPLLKHHGIFFLTETRRNQFDKAMFILQKEIKLYEELDSSPSLISSMSVLPTTALEYVNLSFFKNWIVGFTNAEGSFFIKSNNDGCFQLKQRIHIELFESFKLIFNTERSISFEKEKYAQFSVSSKRDIQTVINYFSFSGLHPLIGLKSIQYFKWLTSLKNSYRYNSLIFPD